MINGLSHPSSLPERADVVVIGAGPAGASSAAILARCGWNVCVVEREQFPRFVIGESLLPRVMQIMEESGLLPGVQAEGFLVKRGALFLSGEERCEFNFSDQFSTGWDYAYQVPRDRFDQILAEGAAAAGASIHYRHSVEAIDFAPDPVLTVRDDHGAARKLSCRFVMDGSGYGRTLPRLLNLDAPSSQPGRVSIFAHVRGDIRPEGDSEGHIWACMQSDRAWIWIIPFSDGRTSVGVVSDAEFLDSFPPDPWDRMRAIIGSDPNASRRLARMEPVFAPRMIKAYSVSVSRVFGPRYCLIGNSTEFIDPIFSSGVMFAMESARRAAELVDRELKGEAPDWQRDYAEPMSQGFDAFRAYINAWYDGSLKTVLFAGCNNPSVRRQICSVLAGNVWDATNPFACDAERKLAQLTRLLGHLSRA